MEGELLVVRDLFHHAHLVTQDALSGAPDHEALDAVFTLKRTTASSDYGMRKLEYVKEKNKIIQEAIEMQATYLSHEIIYYVSIPHLLTEEIITS